MALPEVKPSIDGLPGAELGRHLAPGRACLHDPQHAFEYLAMVSGGTSGGWGLGGQEGSDWLPAGRCQGGKRGQDEGSGEVESRYVDPRSRGQLKPWPAEAVAS